MVMVLCVMLCVGRCKRGAVGRRSWLGLGGVGIVVASGVAAYGLCSGFGEMPMSALTVEGCRSLWISERAFSEHREVFSFV